MKKKSFSISLAAVLIAAIPFLTVNCETGLGPAVDVQKPSVAITYPPSTAAIREAFVLAGTCDDDQGVVEITVTVYDSENQKLSGYEAVPANIAEDGKSWSVMLNEGAENPEKGTGPLASDKIFPIKDGSYTVQAQAKDKAGRESDIVARSFDIDNTPPILILNKPMAKADNKPTSYGRVFKLAGDTNDDHSIKVAFYFRECEKPSAEVGDAVVFKNEAPLCIGKEEYTTVSSMSSDAPLILARYYDKPADPDQATLTENYNNIYGTVKTGEKNDPKYYYGGIRLMDTAKVYQNPAEDANANDSRGNETTTYFLNTDELSKTLNGIGTDGVKAGDIKKIVNGTAAASYSEADRQKIGEALSAEGNYVKCGSANDVGVQSSVFSLNPDNNPTWSIANYSIKPEDTNYAKDGKGYRDYNLGANHTLTITPNTDGDYVSPKKVSLYAVQVVEAGGGWVEKGDPICLLEEGAWDEESSSEAVSVGGIKLENLGAGEYYKFILKGTDREDNDYAPADDNGYGLKVATSEMKPTLTVTSRPCDVGAYFKLSRIEEGIKWKGTISDSNKRLGYLAKEGTDEKNIEPLIVEAAVTGPDGKTFSSKTMVVETKLWAVTTDENNAERKILWDESSDETSWNLESMSWEWEATIADPGFKSYARGNYTYAVSIVATSRLGKEKGEVKDSGAYNGDNEPPTVAFTNPDFLENGALKASPKVFDNSKQLTGTGASRVFELTGSWSDANGSGTGKLYYWYGESIPAKNSDGWIEATENQASSENRNESGTKWSVEIPNIGESVGNVFAVWAKDMVGNEMGDPIVVEDVMFDFGAPEVEMTCGSTDILENPLSLGKQEGSNELVINGTVSDTYKLDPETPITVKVYKDNVEQPEDDKPCTFVFAKSIGSNGKSGTWTITLDAAADIEGKWKFEATAKDAAGRDTAVTSKTVEIDTKPPVMDGEYTAKIGGVALSELNTKWVTSTAVPELDVQYKETGLEAKLEYILSDAAVTTNEAFDDSENSANRKGPYSLSNTAADIWKSSGISITMPQGKKTLSFRVKDASGNISEIENYTVNVDTVAPTVTYAGYKEGDKNGSGNISTKGGQNITINVTSTEETSGLDKVVYKFDGTEIKANDTGFTVGAIGPTSPAVSGRYATSLTIDASQLTEKEGADKAYTVTATAYDKAGLVSGETTLCTITVDTTPPKLEVTNVTSEDIKEIDGTDYYLLTEDSLNSITKNKTDTDTTKYNFTLRGTWSDEGGTGTDTLSYATTSTTPGINVWNKLKPSEAPNSTSEVSWSKQFSVDYNDQKTYNYWFKAVDKAGNETAAGDIVKLENVVFDFSAPTISIDVPKELTNLKADGNTTAAPLVITVKAHDDRKLNTTPITLDIKKDDVDKAADTNLVITKSEATNNGRDVTWEVTISDPGANGFDGKWSITATAKDEVERTASETKAFTIDTKAPVINNNDTLVLPGQSNAKLNDSSKWYKTYSFTIQGKCSDNVSGVDTIYYWVKNQGSSETLDKSKPKGSIEVKNIVEEDTFKISTEGFEAGENQIFFWAKDAAGNVSTEFSHTLKVDDEVPSAEIDTTADGYRTLTNDSEKLVFKGTVKDNASGVTKLTLTLGTVTLAVTSETSAEDVANGSSTPADKGTITLGTQRSETIDDKTYYVRDWTAEFNAGIFGGAETGSKPLGYIVEDGAGMKNTSTFVTIKLDKAKPNSKITQPATGATGVNKVFNVVGSTEDGSDNLKSVELKYKVGDGSFTSFTGGLKKNASGSLEKEGEYYVWDKNGTGGIKLDATGPSLDWKVKIDSVEAFGGENKAQGKEVTLSVEAIDEAGNTAEAGSANSKSVTFTVDQNADRPVIKLNTTVKKVGETSYISQKTLSGTIEDDDGLTNSDNGAKKLKLWVSKSPINSMPASGDISLTGSEWTFDLGSSEDDGAKSIYFYVEDSEGGEFSYSYNKADNYGNPYFTYTENSDEKTKTNLTAAFGYTQDTTDPLVTKVEWIYDSGSETKTETFPLASKASATIPWLGGTTKKAGDIKITATDTNGISAIRIKVSGGTVTKGFTTGTTETIDNIEYKKVGTLTDGVWTIPLTSIDFANWNSAEYTVSVTATDNSGREGNKANKDASTTVAADYKFKLDFTPPSVTMDVTPSATIITSATITTTFSDDVDGFDGSGCTTNHQWAISKTEPASNSSSWQNVGSSSTLITKLPWEDVSKYSNTEYATYNGTTKLWEVPIWFKVVDELGNTQTVKKTFTIDKESSYAEAEINSPEDGTKVGSTTKLSGIASISGNSGTGAIGIASIREVRVQIDANGDGKYDGDDFAILSGTATASHISNEKNLKSSNSKWKLWAGTKAKFKNTEEYQSGEPTPARLQGTESDWYVLADVNGTNWGLTVPTNLFAYCYKGTKDRPHVKYRVKALGQMSKNKAGTDGLFAMKDYNASGTAGADHIRSWTTGSGASIALATGVDEREIVIDSQAPQIKDIYLVQYTDNNPEKAVSKSRAYTKNMYIGPGQWYITANLEDETALDSYTLSEISNGTGFTFTDVSEEDLSISADLKKKAIKPTQITGSGTESGKLELELGVVDNSAKTAQETITINIDVAAPTIPTDANGLILYDSFSKQISKDVVIENSDGTFRLGNTFNDYEKNLQDEGGSDIAYVAFWFERQPQSTGVKRVFNPMIAHGTKTDNVYKNQTELTDTKTANKVFINDDGLAVMHITGLTRSSDTTITLPSLEPSITQNIRYGGLVQIGGSYVLINKVDGNVLTLNEAADVNFIDAYFVFAQVVNDSSSGADSYGDVGATDGDGMTENLMNKDYGSSNSGWQWYGEIDSTNVPDGPIIVHVTAIDGAGNVSKAQVSTKIANNRPRITRVMVASDWNNNGTYDVRDGTVDGKTVTVDNITNTTLAATATPSGTEFGEFVYYSTIQKGTDYNKLVGLSDATLKSTDGSIFKVPNKLCIIPQFTGGNNDSIKYTWNVVNPSSTGLTSAQKVEEFEAYTTVTTSATPTALVEVKDSITGDTNSKLTSNAEDNNFVANNLQYKGGIELTVAQLETHDDGTKPVKCLAFTFWDATDETTQGVDSLNALLKIPVVLNVKDTTKPHAKIKPFYWTGNKNTAKEVNNNVYIDGSIKGHIELEDDLSTALKDSPYTSGAPKVSGKIIVRGSVYDDVQLSAIAISMEGLDSNNVKEVLTYNTTNQTWTSTADGTNIVSASATNEYADQTGHKANYEFVLDTEKIANVADLNKVIRVFAKDWKSNISKVKDGGYDATFTGTQTVFNKVEGKNDLEDAGEWGEGPWTDYYKVDVVPYITGVTTSLSNINKKVPSVFNRTALGHYPVYQRTKPNVETETFTLTGYNLGGNASGSVTNTGAYKVTVNNVDSINNINNNDAHGSYTHSAITGATGDKDIYDNYYNRQPNGQNNNLLTDDIVFDAWEFNSKAAIPISGKIEQPVMKIRPSDGKIGFAFVNGPLYFSMGGSSKASDGINHDTQDYSYQYWLGSFDFFTSVDFAYDDLGNSYGVAAGGDINSTSADKFQFMTSLWGRSGTYQSGSYAKNNSIRMESIGQKNANEIREFDKQRIKSPSIATTVNGVTPNVYLAYYDAMNSEIRFKSGTYQKPRIKYTYSDGCVMEENQVCTHSVVLKVTGADTASTNYRFGHAATDSALLANNNIAQICDVNGTVTDETKYILKEVGGNSDNHWFRFDNLNGEAVVPFPFGENNYTTNDNWIYPKSDFYIKVTPNVDASDKLINTDYDFGMFTDYDVLGDPYAYRNEKVSMIAGSNTGNGAGEYVSIAAVPASVLSSANDTVVAVWYDASARELKYSYHTNPLGITAGDTNATGWSAPSAIFSTTDYYNAGEYCQIAVDKKGGIHIAAYDPANCDLVYAYAPSYDGSFTSCIVDGNGVVGNNITIDVALDSSGKIMPQIGYYATSAVRPKYARLVTAGTLKAGTENDEFTGVWECTIIPTPSTVNMQSNQYNKINVGVWKDSSGKVKASTTGSSSTTNTGSSYSATSYGNCYGNGTSNAVLGYTIKVNASSDAIETAQMK